MDTNKGAGRWLLLRKMLPKQSWSEPAAWQPSYGLLRGSPLRGCGVLSPPLPKFDVYGHGAHRWVLYNNNLAVCLRVGHIPSVNSEGASFSNQTRPF